MRRFTIFILMCALIVTSTGCGIFKSLLDGDSEMDRMWSQGYGFNNPNASKEKAGSFP
jgi:hypothetical protein